jgi:hypothetical protein
MRNVMGIGALMFGLMATSLKATPPAFVPKLRVVLTQAGSKTSFSSATTEGRNALAKMSKEDQTAVREFVQAMELYRENGACPAWGGSSIIQELYGVQGKELESGDALTEVLKILTQGNDIRLVLEINDNRPIQGRSAMNRNVLNHRFHFSLEVLKEGSMVRSFDKAYALRPGAGDRKLYYCYALTKAIQLATPREAWTAAEKRAQEALTGRPSDEHTEPFENVLKALER